ncbi:MAG: phosphatase PAP2 family protein [Candidatus Acidiferrales bacterium]|jgi:membrane-associated phospholipid phosphatase
MVFAKTSSRRSSHRIAQRAAFASAAALLFFIPATVSAQTELPSNEAIATTQSAMLNDTLETGLTGAGLTSASVPPASAPAICDFRTLLQCAKDIGHDQVGIWTSPSRIKRRDLIWIAPFAIATVIAFRTDSDTSQDIGFNPKVVNVGNKLSDLGSGYATVGFGAALWTIGDLTHHQHFAETGRLGLEAIADAYLVDEAMKIATNRQRPYQNTVERGDFWEDGTKGMFNSSFPSGHAITTWALARVVTEEYPNTWVRIGAYSIATLVSLGRITAQKHFPSDVVVGGTLGYLIGGYVFRQHASEGRGVVASVLPFADTASRTYGATIQLRP